MAKILVVDDEADLEVLIKQKFRQKIRENKYQFLFAINGKKALEQLDEHTDVDIVLSDINMPEMD
ncbi:MAG: response regulator, partial [Chitinophagaceae bacterium]|nr:response regulator [Chitinophagaceae bacterium]